MSINLKTVFCIFTVLGTAILSAPYACSQISVNSTISPEQLVQSLVGEGISFSNVTYNGGTNSRGTFSGLSSIGMGSGIVLSTGNINSIPNPPSAGMGGSGSLVVQNDPDMNAICGTYTNNGSILEFDFIAQSNQITLSYLMASEEYAAYAPPCNSPYNDGNGIFLSGPGIAGPYSNNSMNIALIPSTSLPVSISNINCQSNSDYYVTNYVGSGGCSGCGNSGQIHAPGFVFNGYTTVIQLTAAITPCTTYHIKLAVANAADQSMQTGIFFLANSLSGTPLAVTASYSNPQLGSNTVEGCSTGTVTFEIDHVATSQVTIPLTYSGTANSITDFSPSLPSGVTIPAGSRSTSFVVAPVEDGITESNESLHIIYSTNTCSGSQTDSATFQVSDHTMLSMQVTDDQTIQYGQSVSLTVTPDGGVLPYQYLWSNGGHTQTITVSPTSFTSYTACVTDGCLQTLCDMVLVNVIVYPQANFSYSNGCSGSPIQFTDLSQPGTGIITSWFWDFGDSISGSTNNSTIQNPVHHFSSAGVFSVMLIVGNSAGGIDTVIQNVNVLPNPSAQFTFCPLECQGSPVHFNDLSSTVSGYITTWIWDLGDGTQQTVTFPNNPCIEHEYQTSGTYLVSLTVITSDSCTDTFTTPVTLSPVVSPTLSGPTQVGAGTTQVYSTEMGMSSYQWSVSSGGTISSGGSSTDHTVSVAWNTAGSQSVSVSYTSTNVCNTGVVTMLPVDVQETRSLTLTVFLESLYDGGSTMRKAQNAGGDQYSGAIADKVTVELHSASDYAVILYSDSTAAISTSGTISMMVPAIYDGTYYITVKHRNSIETTSAMPVSFAVGSVTYDFDAAAKAFGGNLRLIGEKYCIYGGDVNQDGLVDSGDMVEADNGVINWLTGYLTVDVNGDGLIDSGDMIIIDNNATAFVNRIIP